ncbi:branched-chain amino acid transport system permease protein [Streptosporangium becharense]|uniref:Branched-chain amino acid transport system permease protein n=1 Tax=Streptosporangium becharense TaxID=1816182 RepID=A0A7W9ICM7_9ACTN|nr:branched-chain amino acid ABC transporter permease [Streptosporangium becharense]MBB2912933.1 branched-chain amino acid transport system permease protein [Streptosporangium becharense]MBB5818242.1 branched-chain amino acid transport system permease protein [Streptosporangium becharense]
MKQKNPAKGPSYRLGEVIARVLSPLGRLFAPLRLAFRWLDRAGDALRDRWAGASGWQRWTVYLLLIVGALLLPSESLAPIMSPYTDWGSILFFPIGTYVLLAIGLNVVVGQAGLLDLGFVAFYAVGGYAMALLGTRLGWNFWLILLVGIGICALSGITLGAPTLRLRGDYLAIVTLGFGEIIRITARNTDEIGGPNGIRDIPHPPSIEGVELFGIKIFKYGVLDPRPYYYLLVALAVIVIILVKRWEKSRVGRAWAAIREDEDAAEVMGVPTFRFKMLAFAIGASIGGAMGVLWASKVVSINPNDFQFLLSATILAAVVMGGAGNLPGVMLGAFVVAWLPERFRGLAEYRMLIFGAALVALMIFRPEGLLPSRQRKAELKEGTGGMGSLGAEVPGPETKGQEVAVK